MKKLFLSFAVIAGFAMVSCGNKAENAEATEAQDTVAVEEVAVVEEVVDSAAAATDTVAAAADSAAVAQ